MRRAYVIYGKPTEVSICELLGFQKENRERRGQKAYLKNMAANHETPQIAEEILNEEEEQSWRHRAVTWYQTILRGYSNNLVQKQPGTGIKTDT